MEYHVIGTEDLLPCVLHVDEIQEMDYDNSGRIIVFGNNQKTYFLLANAHIISD